MKHSQNKEAGPWRKTKVLLGGERGIRTLETLLTPTRFPIVRLRPAQPSLHSYAVFKLPDYITMLFRQCQAFFQKSEGILLLILFPLRKNPFIIQKKISFFR